MIVELVSVGTELLLGNIVNTNAAYLSEQCAALGLSVYYQTVVGDNPKRLEEALKIALKRSDIIMMTGGLGPTKDDLTKETAAKLAGLKLVEDSHTRECIQKFFDKRKKKKITENNWKQALVPEGSIVVENKNGTAPGLIIKLKWKDADKQMILMPGPPNECRPMFENDIFPYLRKQQPEIIYSVTAKVCGLGESFVETEIADLIDRQTNPTIAPYAKTNEVHLRVTAKASDEAAADKMIKPVIKELKKRFGHYLYTTKEEETLEETVVKMLKDRGMTITTAESCTGGLLASTLVNVPGVSDCFKSGYITYSNKAKQKLLGVQKSILKKHGAVSEKTAKEMAKGCAAAAKADAGVSITGTAGPDGTPEEPAGLVYAGCCVNGKTKTAEFRLTGNRQKIREYAVAKTLVLIRECLLEADKQEEK